MGPGVFSCSNYTNGSEAACVDGAHYSLNPIFIESSRREVIVRRNDFSVS